MQEIGLILLTFVLMAESSNVSHNQPIVHLKLGKLRGILNHGSIGNVSVFLGIQYGEAPTGKYRFRTPVPSPMWNGIKNAHEYGPICIQTELSDFTTKIFYESQMSENCLFLNIYVPRIISEDSTFQKLPVLVYIHSGNFREGAGSLLDGTNTAVHTDSVVVTFNYRLGIFGFLSLTNHTPGNFGLLDQVLALRWIKNNIASFGGDSENMSILTGSVEANIIQSSHQFKNLFNRIISYDEVLSCSFNRSGLSDEILQSAIVSSRCHHLDILTCLQNLSTEEIKNISSYSTKPWKTTLFQPVIDEVVIKDHPEKLIVKGDFIHVDQLIFSQSVKPLFPWIHSDRCTDNTLVTTIDYISNFVHNGLNTVQKLVLKTMFSPIIGTSDQYCAKVISLINELNKSNIVRIIKERSKYALTYLALFSNDNPVYTQRKTQNLIPNVTDYYSLCTMIKQANDKCPENQRQDEVTDVIIRAFLHFGYPSAWETLIWRPYSVQNHNHITVTANVTETGDGKTWPFLKVEMLWNQLIPSLLENKTTSNKNEEITGRHPTAAIDWGMSEQQLEALLFSLILTCLFLLLSSLTLLRIVCYVKGKPFQKLQTKPSEKPAFMNVGGEMKHNGINKKIQNKENKEIPGSCVEGKNDEVHDGRFKESSVL